MLGGLISSASEGKWLWEGVKFSSKKTWAQACLIDVVTYSQLLLSNLSLVITQRVGFSMLNFLKFMLWTDWLTFLIDLRVARDCCPYGNGILSRFLLTVKNDDFHCCQNHDAKRGIFATFTPTITPQPAVNIPSNSSPHRS